MDNAQKGLNLCASAGWPEVLVSPQTELTWSEFEEEITLIIQTLLMMHNTVFRTHFEAELMYLFQTVGHS